jgi:hypothetical protein
MNKGLKWTIRVVVTFVALILVASMGTEKTLDPGSVLVAMLLVIAGTVWVWYMTRTKKPALERAPGDTV